jgi:paraquat-inducible protein B
MPNVDAISDKTVAEAQVVRRRRISIVWVIPIVAVVIGVWLAYKTITEQGPYVTVTFETAEGLEADKTKVKYRDVEVGMVDDIELAADRSHVVVGIRIKKNAERFLTESTNFWIVRARLDASGASGLSTLLSGAYVEIEPGAPGKRRTSFTGLETPPVVRIDAPGRRFVLMADRLGSLSAGSPIHYRGLLAGEILGHQLADDRRSIRVHAFVKAPFDQLVLENSRFWNVSGIEVVAGTEGLSVRMESLSALLTGGVSFESSPELPGATPAPADKVFHLFQSHDEIREAAIVDEIPYVLYFDNSVRGLSPGAPVEFRGVRVGTVKSIQPEIDLGKGTVRISVRIALQPERFSGDAQIIGNLQEQQKYVLLAALVERGLRAQLETASLITGQQFVSLEFFPDEPKKTLGREGKVPEIPTVPSRLDQIGASATRLVNKLNDLPLDVLVANLITAVKTLDGTLLEATTLSQRAQGTLSTINGAVGKDSDVRQNLSVALRDLAESARSVRDLADYLERHPDALIKGKTP